MVLKWDQILNDEPPPEDYSYLSKKEQKRERFFDKIEKMKARYEEAKEAPVGTIIRCPTCGKEHQKTSYHNIFCCNMKTKGKGNCKDKYWNMVRDPNRYV